MGGTPADIRASELMSHPVLVVDADARLATAMDRLTASGLRHLVVVSNGRCVGVLTDRLVAAVWPMVALGPGSQPIARLLSHDPVTVTPDDTPRTIARRMLERGVDAVAVVDTAGRVVGIVTGSDLLRHFVSDDDTNVFTEQVGVTTDKPEASTDQPDRAQVRER
jgi:CBS domain-containing protein